MSKNTTLNGDFLISGGGPVGLTLAIGLARQGFSVILLEAEPLAEAKEAAQTQTENAFDGRVLALSLGSIKLLQSLAVWSALKPLAVRISDVHVSQKGFMGITTLNAEEIGVPALGYSVEGKTLGEVLWQEALKYENIQVLRPMALQSFAETENKGGQDRILAQVSAPDGTEMAIECGCLIGADGTHSKVRQGLNIPMQVKDYNAFGILAKIESREDPKGLAFERFTAEGPVALLPMQGKFHKAVWVCPAEQKDAILALDDQAYLRAFEKRMGARFGGFVSVSKRLAYPLKETSLPQIAKGAVVLMGNAAHTQHPVAAQGLNLGLADIADFLQRLPDTSVQNPQALQAMIIDYAANREEHHKKVMGMTDGLIGLFQHPSAAVGHLRGLGLMAMQALPPVKRRFARFAMGSKV